MQAIETEIKILISDREDFEQRLPKLGFKRVTARTFERNTLYDTPEHLLRSSRQILRLRQYGGVWLVTHKCLLPNDAPEARHKARLETESIVEDGKAMGKIFESLGFKPSFVYEKWRTEWKDDEGHCVLDETPLGLYAELEGPIEWIDRTAKNLQIRDEEFIKLSYGRIFEEWRDRSGLKVENFTFAEIPQSFRQTQ